MANFGESFWGGANAGASMASKWVNTYNTGEDRRNEDKYREGAKAIETDWASAKEKTQGMSEAERAKFLETQRSSLLDRQRSLAQEYLGSKGVDVAGNYVTTFDNGNKAVNNAAVLDNRNAGGQELLSSYEKKKPLTVVQAPTVSSGNSQADRIRNSAANAYNRNADMAATGAAMGEKARAREAAYNEKSLSLLRKAQEGDKASLAILNRVAGNYGGATVSFGDNGMPSWGPEGQQVPMDMEAYIDLGNRYFCLSDALENYRNAHQ